MPPIHLLLADDNPLVLEMLVDLLQGDFVIEGAFPNGSAVLRELDKLHPDVFVLDISLGDMTGFELASRLRERNLSAKIIFLSIHESVDFVRAAFQMGASGYVFKSRVNPDLMKAIEIVASGGLFAPYSSTAVQGVNGQIH